VRWQGGLTRGSSHPTPGLRRSGRSKRETQASYDGRSIAAARRCAPRATAGTTAELCNLTRFLTYHGHRAEARRLYAGLDDAARDWHGADLEAARRACPNRLDFARLLPRADEILG
jgi:hypothetical protein